MTASKGTFRVFGIEIRIDASLLIIFALIVYNLGAVAFVKWHPDWSAALRWTTALFAAVAFFASVLAHELSHALVGRGQGIVVRRITLFLFGGLAHMENRPGSPKAEFLMAVVGPLTSMLIGIVATVVAWGLAGIGPAAATADLEAIFQNAGPVSTVLLWLGPINLMLGAFNLVPGFPLDGGRVLRSMLWWATGDLTKATRWAASVGRGVATLMMAWGAMNVFAGALLGGLWLILIAWFLHKAARASYQDVLVRSALAHVPVSRVMLTSFERASPDLSIERLVRHHLMARDQRAFPVEEDGRFVGLVCIDDVRGIDQTRWDAVPVSQIMTPRDELVTLPPDAPAEKAFEELARQGVDQIPVIDGGHLTGLVRRRDVIEWLALQGVG